MSDIVRQAHERIAELEAELEELRNFVAVAGRLSGLPQVSSRPVRAKPTSAATSPGVDVTGSSPKEIVRGLFHILSESGETLDRDALIQRLEACGIKVPGIYANKNLATILWRNQRLFEHLQGTGYKWTGAPLEAPAK
jgi:hypothetical protein